MPRKPALNPKEDEALRADCLFPNYLPLTAYSKGCRCDSCLCGRRKRSKKETKKYRAKKAAYSKRLYYEKGGKERRELYYQEKHSEIRSHQNEYARTRRNEKRIYDREYRRKNRERVDARIQKWREENPERMMIARLKAAITRRDHQKTRMSGETRKYVEILLRDPCAYCDAPMRDIDHIVPVAARGDANWTNLTGACHSCNLKKGAKPMLHFLLEAAS